MDEMGKKAVTRDGRRLAAGTAAAATPIPQTVEELLYMDGVVLEPHNVLGFTVTGNDLATMSEDEFAQMRYRVSLLMGDMAHWNRGRAPAVETQPPPSPSPASS